MANSCMTDILLIQILLLHSRKVTSVLLSTCLVGTPIALNTHFLAASCFHASALLFSCACQCWPTMPWLLHICSSSLFLSSLTTAGPTEYAQYKLEEWPLLQPFQEDGLGQLCLLCTVLWKRWWLYRRKVSWPFSYLICCGCWWQSCGEWQHPQGSLQLLGRQKEVGHHNGLWATMAVKGQKYLEVHPPCSGGQYLHWPFTLPPLMFFPQLILSINSLLS